METAALSAAPPVAEVDVLAVSQLFADQEVIVVPRVLENLHLEPGHVLRTKDRTTAWRIVTFSYPCGHTRPESFAFESFATLERLFGGLRIVEGDKLDVVETQRDGQ